VWRTAENIPRIEGKEVSHDFAFWDSEEPLEDGEAGNIYSALCRNAASERVKASAKIARLAKEINSRWPTPASGDEDDWPLAAPIEVSESHLVICLVRSRVWDVWPTLGQIAQEHELVMYDPQQQCVFLPRRLSKKRTRARAKRKHQAHE
jgi:hypothetical protein